MKVLDIDKFISERIKVQPVTNSEFDKAMKDIELTMPVEVPVSSLESVDDLQPGWLVFIIDNRNDIRDHYVPRLVVSGKYAKNMFTLSFDYDELVFVRSNPEHFPTYLLGSAFQKNTFPSNVHGRFVIDRAFKNYAHDLEKICKDRHEFVEWYEKQNFDDLLK